MPTRAYFIKDVIRGETFFLELNVEDSDGEAIDITNVVKTIVTEGSQLAPSDFALTDGDDKGDLEIRALKVKTLLWPLGITTARIWFDWGVAADIVDEVILTLKINVTDTL